jgi:hypothetical protein
MSAHIDAGDVNLLGKNMGTRNSFKHKNGS